MSGETPEGAAPAPRSEQGAETARLGPGVFVAVVGASGSGKDSLLGIAARAGYAVPRRVITRAASASEDNESVSAEQFARLVGDGAFAVSWHAHGHGYGIPRAADARIADGETVLVNVSRTVLAQLAERYAAFRVVRVGVDPAVRAQRLSLRGRDEDLVGRLTREDPAPDFPVDLELDNSGRLEDAGAALLAFLAAVDRPGSRS